MKTTAERSFTIRQIGEVVSDYAGDDEDANGRFPGVVLAGGHEAVRAAARFLLDRVVIVPQAAYDELVDLLRKVPSALNNTFMAGGEEREFGSATRQEQLMKPVHELQRAIEAALRKAEGAE